MKYKYVILGNIVGFTGIGAIVTAGYDWRLSAILGLTSGIVGNYMFFDIRRKVNEMLKTIIDSIGGYVGLKFEDGKIVRVSGEVDIEKLEEMLGDVKQEVNEESN